MERKFYQIILMFTIGDDEKRKKFIECAVNELNAQSLEDQSTLSIPLGVSFGQSCDRAKGICDRLQLSGSDFVNMYCSAKLCNYEDTDKEHSDKIVAVKIK